MSGYRPFLQRGNLDCTVVLYISSSTRLRRTSGKTLAMSDRRSVFAPRYQYVFAQCLSQRRRV